jgi:hypothetical protein
MGLVNFHEKPTILCFEAIIWWSCCRLSEEHDWMRLQGGRDPATNCQQMSPKRLTHFGVIYRNNLNIYEHEGYGNVVLSIRNNLDVSQRAAG